MTYNKEWFSSNVKLHQSGLYGLAISILKNEEDAKDAVQETLYKAFYNIDSLRNPEKFKPWIMKILANTAYEMIRNKKYQLNIDDYNDIIETPNTLDLSTKINLWDAVQSLNLSYRPIIIMFYYEDLSIKEISEILSLTPVTTRKRLSRARKQLKQILEGKEV